MISDLTGRTKDSMQNSTLSMFDLGSHLRIWFARRKEQVDGRDKSLY